MTRGQWLKLGAYVGGVVLIIFVLTLSITRQALYSPTIEEQQARAKISVGERMTELRTWPPLPDHPLYPLRMIQDRVRLLLSRPPQSTELQLSYADRRIDAAKILISRKRYTLALTTLTKAAKYSITAADSAEQVNLHQSTTFHASVGKKLRDQSDEMVRLKPFFSDAQRSVIDRLLAEIAVKATRFP